MAGNRRAGPAVRRAATVLGKALLHLLGALGGSPRARTLVWHGIGDEGGPLAVSRADFGRQLDLLLACGVRAERAGEAVGALTAGAGRSARAVALTFDDGLASVVQYAWPELERRGLPATVFVVTGEVGTHPSWPQRDAARIANDLARHLGAAGGGELRKVQTVLSQRLATWEELATGAARGFEVLPHGRHHRFLDALSEAELEEEIAGAASDLQCAGFPRPCAMAWPYGVTDERAIAVARRAGLAGAFAAECAWVRRRDDDLYRLNRVPVSGATTPADLRFALGRGYDLLAFLRSVRGEANLARGGDVASP